MGGMRRSVAAVLLVACGCGGSSTPGPASIRLLDVVAFVAVPNYSSTPLAAFALGTTPPGTTPDLFLLPTDGFPGCAVVGSPFFPEPPLGYGWGGFPNGHSIVVADFDEDGFPDDAVATSLAGATGQTWIMGGLVQDLAFLYPDPWHEVSTGIATRLVAGDWDDDFFTDLALLEPLETRVKILLGDGNGHFVAPTRTASSYDVGLAATTLIVADVNADLRPDLVVANGFAGTLEILLGDGDGGFTAAPDATGVPGVQYMTSADFDDDGHLDLALSSQTQDAVVILRGQGDGTFQAPDPVSMPADCAPTGIAAADLDGDGDIDLVVGLNDDDDIAVILNDGRGGMALPPAFRYEVGGTGLPRQVEVGDLEGDGDLDVFVLTDLHVVIFEQT